MRTQGIEAKKAIFYLLWISFFIGTLIVFPHYLGLIIAKNQWHMLGLVVLGILVITLYFSEFRYLIVSAAVTLLFANSFNERIVFFFATLRWVFLITMAVVAVAHWVLGRVPSRIRTIDLWAVPFVVLAFYSNTYSIMPSLTFERSLATLAFYLAVFWGVWNYVQDEAKIPCILHDLLRVSFIVFFFGLTLVSRDRFFGIFGNPNSIGIFSAILAPLAFWSYLCERKRSALYLLLLMGVSLFLSQSRAGIISTVVGAGYFLTLYQRRRRFMILTLLIFFLGLSFLYVELFGSSLFEQYFRWETLLTGGGRLEAWREVFRLIRLRPWLGYGFGTEDQLFLKFDIVFLEHAGAYAHNSYIGLVSQLGVVGASIFFVPLVLFFLRRAYSINRMPSGKRQWLELALNASILGGLVNAIFESWPYAVGNSFAFPFWVIVVIAYQLAHPYPVKATSRV